MKKRPTRKKGRFVSRDSARVQLAARATASVDKGGVALSHPALSMPTASASSSSTGLGRSSSTLDTRKTEATASLHEFCTRCTIHASLSLDDALREDMVRTMLGMVRSQDGMIAASAATALASVLRPTRECEPDDGVPVQELHDASSTNYLLALDQDLSVRVRRLHLRNSRCDVRAAVRARQKHGMSVWSGLLGGERRVVQRVVCEGTHDTMRSIIRLLRSRDATVRCAGAHAIRNATDHFDNACNLVQEAGGIVWLHRVLINAFAAEGEQVDDDHESAMASWERAKAARAIRATMSTEAVEEAHGR